MNATSHSVNRVNDRLIAAGIDPTTAEDIRRTAEAFASKCNRFESVALRMKSLSYFVGRAWSDTSNGDTIIAIIRFGQVQTYMFRRRTQPFDKQSLSVERVVTL